MDGKGGRATAVELELGEIGEPYRGLRAGAAGRVARLVASLIEQGQRSPVFVVASAGAARPPYVLIDGYVRLEALRRAGHDTVQAIVLDLGEAEALGLSFRLDGGRRRSALEEGWLVRELVERHGFDLARVGRELERTKSWVSRRLALVRELPEAVQELVRRGAVSAHAAVRSLVPLARANGEASVRIAEIAAEHSLSSRQTAKLVGAYRVARGEQRTRLLSSPLVYLRAEEHVTGTRSESRAPRLVRDFEILIGVARRAAESLRSATADQGTGEALTLVWPRTEQALERLWVAVEERIGARSGHADRHPAAAL